MTTHEQQTDPERRPVSRRAALFGLGGVALFGTGYAAGRGDVVGDLARQAGIIDVPALKPERYEITIPWLPETVRRWQEPVVAAGRKYEVDPNYISILMTLESGGYSLALSEADAKGLMQITPPTEGDIAAKYLKDPPATYNIWDPATNIEFGAAYIAYLREEFAEPDQGPSWNYTAELIAAGYNGGPGAAGDLYNGRGLESDETLIYSRDAHNMWRERNNPVSLTLNRWIERGGSRLLELAATEQR